MLDGIISANLVEIAQLIVRRLAGNMQGRDWEIKGKFCSNDSVQHFQQ